MTAEEARKQIAIIQNEGGLSTRQRMALRRMALAMQGSGELEKLSAPHTENKKPEPDPDPDIQYNKGYHEALMDVLKLKAPISKKAVERLIPVVPIDTANDLPL